MSLTFIPSAVEAKRQAAALRAKGLISSAELTAKYSPISSSNIAEPKSLAPKPQWAEPTPYADDSLEAMMQYVDSAMPGLTKSRRDQIKYRIQRLGMPGKRLSEQARTEGGASGSGKFPVSIDPLDVTNVMLDLGKGQLDPGVEAELRSSGRAAAQGRKEFYGEELRKEPYANDAKWWAESIKPLLDAGTNMSPLGLGLKGLVSLHPKGEDLLERSSRINADQMGSLASRVMGRTPYQGPADPLARAYALMTGLPGIATSIIPKTTEAMGEMNLEQPGTFAPWEFAAPAVSQGGFDAIGMMASFAPLAKAPAMIGKAANAGFLGTMGSTIANEALGKDPEAWLLGEMQKTGEYDPAQDPNALQPGVPGLPGALGGLGIQGEDQTGIPQWAQALRTLLGFSPMLHGPISKAIAKRKAGKTTIVDGDPDAPPYENYVKPDEIIDAEFWVNAPEQVKALMARKPQLPAGKPALEAGGVSESKTESGGGRLLGGGDRRGLPARAEEPVATPEIPAQIVEVPPPAQAKPADSVLERTLYSDRTIPIEERIADIERRIAESPANPLLPQIAETLYKMRDSDVLHQERMAALPSEAKPLVADEDIAPARNLPAEYDDIRAALVAGMKPNAATISTKMGVSQAQAKAVLDDLAGDPTFQVEVEAAKAQREQAAAQQLEETGKAVSETAVDIPPPESNEGVVMLGLDNLEGVNPDIVGDKWNEVREKARALAKQGVTFGEMSSQLDDVILRIRETQAAANLTGTYGLDAGTTQRLKNPSKPGAKKPGKKRGAVDLKALVTIAAGIAAISGILAANSYIQSWIRDIPEDEQKQKALMVIGVMMAMMLPKYKGKTVLTALSQKHGWGLNINEAIGRANDPRRAQKFLNSYFRSVDNKLGNLGTDIMNTRNAVERARAEATRINFDHKKEIESVAASVPTKLKQRMFGQHPQLADLPQDVQDNLRLGQHNPNDPTFIKWQEEEFKKYQDQPLWKWYNDPASLHPSETAVLQTQFKQYNDMGQKAFDESGQGPAIHLSNEDHVATLSKGDRVFLYDKDAGDYTYGKIVDLGKEIVIDGENGATYRFPGEGKGSGHITRASKLDIRKSPGRYVRDEVTRAILDGEADTTGLYHLLLEETGKKMGTTNARWELLQMAKQIANKASGSSLFDAAVMHPRISEALPDWAYSWDIRKVAKQNEQTVLANELAKATGGPDFADVKQSMDIAGLSPQAAAEVMDLYRTMAGKPLSHLAGDPHAVTEYMRVKDNLSILQNVVYTNSLVGPDIGPLQLTTIANAIQTYGAYVGPAAASLLGSTVKALASPKAGTISAKASIKADRDFRAQFPDEMGELEKAFNAMGINVPKSAAKSLGAYLQYALGGGKFGERASRFGAVDSEVMLEPHTDRHARFEEDAAMGRGGSKLSVALRRGTEGVLDIGVGATVMKPLDSVQRKITFDTIERYTNGTSNVLRNWLNKNPRSKGQWEKWTPEQLHRFITNHREGRTWVEEVRVTPDEAVDLIKGKYGRGSYPDSIVSAFAIAASKNQGRTTAEQMPRFISKSPVGAAVMTLGRFTYKQTANHYRAMKEWARGNPWPLLRAAAATIGVSLVIEELRKGNRKLWDFTVGQLTNMVFPAIGEEMQAGREIQELDEADRFENQAQESGLAMTILRLYAESGNMGYFGAIPQVAAADDQSWMGKMNPVDVATKSAIPPVIGKTADIGSGIYKAMTEGSSEESVDAYGPIGGPVRELAKKQAYFKTPLRKANE